MNTIGLLTGEDADLPKEIIKKFSLSIFAYTVNGEVISDPSSFYASMRKSIHQTFSTSQPSVKTFQTIFAGNLKKYHDLIIITISSRLSGTYNAALQAKKLFSESEQTRIHLIDSRSASGSEALLVLKAAQLIAAKESVESIRETIHDMISQTHFIGVFDDPHWLQKGGRINTIQATIIKNMLKIGFRPILTLTDGQIVTKKIQKHAKDKVETLLQQFKEETESAKNLSVVITHSDCEKDALALQKMITEYNPSNKVVYVNSISPVLGAHLGYDALLLAWIERHPGSAASPGSGT